MLLFSLVAGCDPATPDSRTGAAQQNPREILEFVPLEGAVRRSPAHRVDLRSQAIEHLLLDGWGPARATHRWGIGQVSTLLLPAVTTADARLRLRGRAFAFPGAQEQHVEILLDGTRLGLGRLPTDGQVHTLEVPLPALEAGTFPRLELRYCHSHPPSEVIPDSADSRPLAVAWVGLSIHTADPETARRGTTPHWEYALPGRGTPRIRFDDGPGCPALTLLNVWTLEADGATYHALDPARRLWRLPKTSTGWLFRAACTTGEGPPALHAERRVPRTALASVQRAQNDSATTSRAKPTAPSARVRTPPQTPRSTPSAIVLWTVDTLRRDALGVYGGPPSDSPALDEFARGATIFEQGHAHASWTRSTMASVFTGMEPQVHGTTTRDAALPTKVPLLPEILRRHGYSTLGVFTNSNAGPGAGFGRGFDRVIHLEEEVTPWIHQSAELVVDHALDWLDGERPAGPVFLHLHVSEPHDPYLPPDATPVTEGGDPVGQGAWMRRLERGELHIDPATRRRLRDLYQDEVRTADRAWGRLLAGLRQRGLYDDALILFLSDHGEEFGEHDGWTHGRTLYEEMLAIPLIVRFPGGESAGRRVAGFARQADLLPTILATLGVEPPPNIQGRGLQRLLEDDAPAVLALAHLGLGFSGDETVRYGDRKLWLRRTAGGREWVSLHDLATDPGETRDRLADDPIWARFLDGLHRRAEAEWPVIHDPETAEIDDQIRQRLVALGYL